MRVPKIYYFSVIYKKEQKKNLRLMFPCLLDDCSESCMWECNAHSAIVSKPPDEINEANEELNISTSVFSSRLELICIEEKEQ